MIQLDNQDIRFLEARVKEYGDARKLIIKLIEELDVRLVMPDGSRPRQSNSYVWQRTLAEFHYLINKCMDEGMSDKEYDNIMVMYNTIMTINTAYETENPPIIYTKKVNAGKRTNKTYKVKSMFNDDIIDVGDKAVKVKPKKETVAERKAKLINSKAVSFAFGNFKAKD